MIVKPITKGNEIVGVIIADILMTNFEAIRIIFCNSPLFLLKRQVTLFIAEQ